MKSKFITLVMTAALTVLTTAYVGSAAAAEEVKMLGPITKLQLAPDGKSATAILKNSKTGELVTITITDGLTLDKFKDKRIVEGDEIRARYEGEGKHISKSFKKAAGC